MNKIHTGSASIKISMPVGADMTGYAGRKGKASGTHDDLSVRTVVFYDGSTTFVLIVCDLLGLDKNFVAETIKLIHKKTETDKDNIVIACTHTHSGPASIKLLNCGSVDEIWLDQLKQIIIESVTDAKSKLKPSILEMLFGNCTIGYNRVLKGRDQADTAIDDQIGILSIKTEDNNIPEALLVNYACHPVVLDEANTLYTRDFPYYMQSRISEIYGRQVELIYTSGCCGDINPVMRGSFEKSEICGKILADEIMRVTSDSKEQQVKEDSNISIDSYDIRVPLLHQLTEGSLLITKKELEEKKDANNSFINVKVIDAYIMWTDEMLGKIRTGTLLSYIDAGIKVISIGKLKIVTLPFEAFHDIGLMLKKHFGEKNTFVICYANGDFGYMASEKLYDIAEYETRNAYKFYGYPGPLIKEAQSILINALTGKG